MLSVPRDAVGYRRAASVAEALELAARPGHALVAGATVFAIAAEAGTANAEVLVDISGLDALAALEVDTDKGRARIGAGTTLAAVLGAGYGLPPVFTAAAAGIGSPSLRHLATVGGNLGWGSGDLASALIVLDAVLEIECASGRATLPVTDYLATPPTEAALLIACEFELPALPGRYEKVGARAAFSPTQLALAAQRIDAGWRLAAHGAGLPARRLTTCEQLLAAGPATAQALAAAVAADVPDTADMRYPRAALPRLIAHHTRPL